MQALFPAALSTLRHASKRFVLPLKTHTTPCDASSMGLCTPGSEGSNDFVVKKQFFNWIAKRRHSRRQCADSVHL